MATAQPKVEKKIMDGKIAKVREVVKNVSTNDIVLALHNYELDVERTIHAFCEGGSEIALGAWEKTGGGKKRSNKKKSKGAASALHSSENISRTTLGTSSITSSISSATYTNGFPSTIKSQQLQPTSIIPLADAPFENTAANEVGPILNISGVDGTFGQQKMPSAIDFNSSTNQKPVVQHFVNKVDSSCGLADYHVHLEQSKAMFETEISTAQENICRCFKEVHDALLHREQQLLAELDETRVNGLVYFNSRNAVLQMLVNKDSHDKNKNVCQTDELEKFNNGKMEDLEIGLTARFLYDNSSLVSSIKQLGKVVYVKKNKIDNCSNAFTKKDVFTNASNKNEEFKNPASVMMAPHVEKNVKRSNSPSSLVSSVDSGLGGQISPVTQEKGQVAQVEENGIMLKSDSISADQLMEIQRNIIESLKAKGIDPMILAEINSSGAMMTAPRRRPPPTSVTKNGTTKQSSGGGFTKSNIQKGKHPTAEKRK